jgi:hypothetical protein
LLKFGFRQRQRVPRPQKPALLLDEGDLRKRLVAAPSIDRQRERAANAGIVERLLGRIEDDDVDAGPSAFQGNSIHEPMSSLIAAFGRAA